MISLRLSDEEYEVVSAAFRQHGARNLSECARAAVLQLAGAPPGAASPLMGSMADLARRVDLVYGEVQRVVSLLVPQQEERGRYEDYTRSAGRIESGD